MNPDPRTRRGAHRTRRAASATLLPSLLAILAVTSLITALYVWRGQDSKPPPAAASARSTTPRSTSGVTTPPAASTSLPTVTHQTTNGTGSNSPKAKAKATRTSAAAALRGSIAIVVLNETTRRGLAATVATRLRSNGWTVSGVGNFRGEVPATTVYYPVGHQAAALAAAKSLPTPARVLPRFGNLSTTRLTIIVTTNYPT